MGYGICLKVWGEYACFTRPEMKVERVSYDVITPSAARGILEAIHWKPSIRWVVDRIHILNPIRFENIRRNEVASIVPERSVSQAMKGEKVILAQYATADRQQRATLMLKDVAYLIEAHFEITDKSGLEDTEEKHYNIFLRRAKNGQCAYRPYLGCREFPAEFQLVEGEKPGSHYSSVNELDFGWILNDIDFTKNMEARFFRAIARNGVIKDIPRI